MAKGDAHLHQRLWLKREQESETTCRFRGRRGQDRSADLRRAGGSPRRSYAETLTGSAAGCWLLRLNVICFSFARAQKADLWLGAAYPSSHPEYEDEPLRRDISSPPRAHQVRVKKVTCHRGRRLVCQILLQCFKFLHFLDLVQRRSVFNFFLITGSSSFFMPSHAAKA